MSPDDPSLPEGWSQADNPEHSPGKYDPRQYIVYERTDRDVGVQIHPSEPNTSTRPQNRWRVIVSRGTTQDSMTVLGDVEGDDAARSLAREFMETYNDRSVGGSDDVDDVIAFVSE
jgi:hypothetical protein